MGEMLARTERNPGTRPSKDGGRMMLPPSDTPTLTELGLTKRESAESQRAVVAAKLANMERGDFHGNQYSGVYANLQIPTISQPEAAKMLNV
jgi:hypothetical protein